MTGPIPASNPFEHLPYAGSPAKITVDKKIVVLELNNGTVKYEKINNRINAKELSEGNFDELSISLNNLVTQVAQKILKEKNGVVEKSPILPILNSSTSSTNSRGHGEVSKKREKVAFFNNAEKNHSDAQLKRSYVDKQGVLHITAVKKTKENIGGREVSSEDKIEFSEQLNEEDNEHKLVIKKLKEIKELFDKCAIPSDKKKVAHSSSAPAKKEKQALNEIDTLKQQIKKMQNEKKGSEKKVKELTKENKEFKSKLEDSNKSYDQSIEELNKQLKKYESDYNNLHVLSQALSINKENINNQNTELNEKLKKTKTKLKDAIEKLKNSEKQIATLNGEIKDLQAEIKTNELSHVAALEKLKATLKQNTSLSDQNLAYKQKEIDALNDKLKSKKEKLLKAQEHARSLDKQFNELHNLYQNKSGEFYKESKQIKDLESEIKGKKGKITEINKKIENLTEENSALKVQLAVAKARGEGKDNEIAALIKERSIETDNLKEQLKKNEAALAEKEKNYKELQTVLADTQRIVEGSKGKADLAAEALKCANEQNKKLESELENLKQTIKDKEAKMEALQNDNSVQQKISELEAKVASLPQAPASAALGGISNSINDVVGQLEELNKSLANMSTDKLDIVADDLKKYEMHLKNLDEKISNIIKILEALKDAAEAPAKQAIENVLQVLLAKQTERDEQKKQNAELNTRYEKLCDSLPNERQNIEAELAKVTQGLEKQKLVHDQISGMCRELQAICDSLTKAHDANAIGIAKLHEEIESLKGELNKAKNFFETARSSKDKLVQSLEEMKGHNQVIQKNLEEQIGFYKKTDKALKEQIDSYKKITEDLKTKNETINDIKGALEEEIDKLKELETDCENLKTEKNRADESFSLDIKELKEEFAKKEREINDVNQNLITMNGLLEEQVHIAEESLGHAVAHEAELQEKIDKLKEKLKQIENDYENLKNEKDKAYESFSSKTTEIEEKIAEKETEINAIKQNLNQKNSLLEERVLLAEQGLNDAKKHEAELQGKLNELSKNNNVLLFNVYSTDEELKSALGNAEQKEQKIQELSKEKTVVNEKLQELQKRLISLSETIKRLQEEDASLSVRNIELEQDEAIFIKESKNKENELLKEIEILNLRIKSLENHKNTEEENVKNALEEKGCADLGNGNFIVTKDNLEKVQNSLNEKENELEVFESLIQNLQVQLEEKQQKIQELEEELKNDITFLPDQDNSEELKAAEELEQLDTKITAALRPSLKLENDSTGSSESAYLNSADSTENLQQQLTEQQLQNTKLKNEIEKLKRDLERLELEKNNLILQSEEKNEEIERLGTVIVEHIQTNEGLTKANGEFILKIQKMKEGHNKHVEKLRQEYEKSQETLQNECNELKKQIEIKDNEWIAILDKKEEQPNTIEKDRQIKRLQSNINLLETQNLEYDLKNKELSESIESKVAINRTLTEENANLKKELDKLASSAQGIQANEAATRNFSNAKLNVLSSEQQSLIKRITDLEAENRTLREEIELKPNDQEFVQKMYIKLNEKESKINELTDEIAELTNTIAKLTNKIADYEEFFGLAANKIYELEKKLQANGISLGDEEQI